jgi:uncharacterized protein (TIGR02996 family)
MTEEQAIIAAVKDRRDDDAPRLAYADYLDDTAADSPDPVAARDRAELIRLQCKLARLPLPPGQSFVRRTVRESDLIAPDQQGLRFLPGWPLAWSHDEPVTGWNWSRGFIDYLACPAADWLAHGDAIAAAHPVRQVRVTTWPSVAAVNEWEQSRYGRSSPFGFYGSVKELFADRWPGITFTLPPTPAYHIDSATITSWAHCRVPVAPAPR